jgi:carbon starvation protein CstA
MVAIPLFVISYSTNMDFGLLWRYFSWVNQITAAILWIEQFICTKRKRIISLSLRPLFITSVVGSYLFTTLQLVLV